MKPQDSEPMVTITKEEFDELKKDADLLECLRQCGVDNWDGWGDALQMREEWYEADVEITEEGV
jgi:hypothetical protein